jgi:outer membrane protein OmpA-like peptidoglycan-associated protein
VVEFEFDCYEPTDSARLVINNVARIMKSDPTLNLFLIGHTDDFGSDEYNLKLSKLRSQSIFQELIVSGLDRSRIMLDYFGEKKPVAPNSTSIGRARNRRVEIWFQ